MATDKQIRPEISKPSPDLDQLISDVEGLEKLQVMQLKLIREIRSQLKEKLVQS